MTATTTLADRLWLRADLPLEDRVEALLAQMTLAEKVGQTHQSPNIDPETDADLIERGGIGSSLYASGATAGNERDGGVLSDAINAAQRHAVQGSRLGIPLLFARDVIHGHRTVYPIPLGMAATFDERLALDAARMAATEASVDGVAWTFAPMLDVSEDPRWGRVAESLGESPVLAGRLGAAMVRGFQGADPSANGTVAACAKHFVGYGMVAGGRDYDTVTVGENTLRNLHLRPFKSVVDAGVMSVMSAFNDIDGVPMHANRHLMREVLKQEWGFTGVVVGDWGGVGQLVEQGVAADLRDAASQAIHAGLDIDMCSGAYAAHLQDLVESGEVAIDLVDDAARRVLRMKLALGLFERPYVGEPTAPPAPTPASRELARDAAASSMVLLSNNGILPLAADPGKVLLTGPFLDEGEVMHGTWVLDGRGEDVASPGAAFRGRLGDALLVDDGRFSDRAIAMVRRADVTVAMVGEHHSRAGEDNCISTLNLPAGQLDVLREMAGLGKPLVVVVFTGRPLDLGPVLDLADAVLLAWHPGTEAGNAVADALFGDVPPRGRLPMTFPRSAGHIPWSSHQRPTGRPLSAADDSTNGRYLDTLVQPRLPFGFGLSYTTFEYGPLTLSSTEMAMDGGYLDASVEVTNSGTRAGREIVQLYLRDLVADVTRPLMELADWALLDLDAGASATTSFRITPDQLGYYDRTMTYRIDPGDAEVSVGPDISRTQVARITVTS
jgi:beta-glucosidase